MTQLSTQKKPKPRKRSSGAKKAGQARSNRHLKEDSKVKEVLQQVAEAAYVVASKTGFRGTFIHFLEELNEALEFVLKHKMSQKGRPYH